MSKVTQNLVCYLFKPEINSFDNVFKIVKGVSSIGEYDEVALQDNVDIEIKGYIKKIQEKKPKWFTKMSVIFNFENEIFNISNSFVFFVKVENRVLAYTMGYAHYALNQAKIEHDFGLKVVLNKISYKDIRGMDTRTLSLSPHQKREVSTSNRALQDFDFDINKELINTLKGKEGYTTLTGKESLKVSIKLDMKKIDEYSKEILEAYFKDDYKENFEFIDNLKIIKDEDILKFFENDLSKSFKSKEKNKIVLAYPNIEDVHSSYTYRIKYGRKRQDFSDINTDILFKFIETKKIGTDDIDIAKFRICLIDDSNEEVPPLKLWDYLVYEFEKDNLNYIYTAKQLYEIKIDYFNSIIDEIDKYEEPLIDKNIKIPDIFYKKTIDDKGNEKQEDEREDSYNLRFEDLNKDECICLDKKNFSGFPKRSQDKVEICDILTKDKEYICVKKYKSSAALSHLFMQGIVSAELLVESKDYRKKIQSSVKGKDKFKEFLQIDNLNRKDITYVYAICMQTEGKISANLPFFSKISLRQSIKNLEKLNFNVKIIRIPFEEKDDFENKKS